jgi:hypothetical protein
MWIEIWPELARLGSRCAARGVLAAEGDVP